MANAKVAPATTRSFVFACCRRLFNQRNFRKPRTELQCRQSQLEPCKESDAVAYQQATTIMNVDYCKQIDDFLNHDIAPNSKTDWEDHIAKCPECKETVAEYRELQTQLKKAWSLVSLKNADFSPLKKSKQPKNPRNQLRKNNDVALAHWIWVVVPILIVAIYLGIVFSYLPQQPDMVEQDPIDAPTVDKGSKSLAVQVVSRDKEDRDFVEKVASTNEFTLVKYHQGIDLKPVSKMEMSVQ